MQRKPLDYFNHATEVTLTDGSVISSLGTPDDVLNQWHIYCDADEKPLDPNAIVSVVQLF